jgi:hypothetical protein
MAADMVTLLIVIIVSCSGFFVAFTFSFAREYSSATDVSYATSISRLTETEKSIQIFLISDPYGIYTSGGHCTTNILKKVPLISDI